MLCPACSQSCFLPLLASGGPSNKAGMRAKVGEYLDSCRFCLPPRIDSSWMLMHLPTSGQRYAFFYCNVCWCSWGIFPRGCCGQGKVATWLILPVVIRSSQRLSHASLSINPLLWNCEWLIISVIVYLIVPYYLDNRSNSRANTCVNTLLG